MKPGPCGTVNARPYRTCHTIIWGSEGDGRRHGDDRNSRARGNEAERAAVPEDVEQRDEQQNHVLPAHQRAETGEQSEAGIAPQILSRSGPNPDKPEGPDRQHRGRVRVSGRNQRVIQRARGQPDRERCPDRRSTVEHRGGGQIGETAAGRCGDDAGDAGSGLKCERVSVERIGAAKRVVQPHDGGHEEEGRSPQKGGPDRHVVPGLAGWCRSLGRRRAFDLRSLVQPVHPRELVAELEIAIEHSRAKLHVVSERVPDHDARVPLRWPDEADAVRDHEQHADADQRLQGALLGNPQHRIDHRPSATCVRSFLA